MCIRNVVNPRRLFFTVSSNEQTEITQNHYAVILTTEGVTSSLQWLFWLFLFPMVENVYTNDLAR